MCNTLHLPSFDKLVSRFTRDRKAEIDGKAAKAESDEETVVPLPIDCPASPLVLARTARFGSSRIARSMPMRRINCNAQLTCAVDS